MDDIPIAAKIGAPILVVLALLGKLAFAPPAGEIGKALQTIFRVCNILLLPIALTFRVIEFFFARVEAYLLRRLSGFLFLVPLQKKRLKS